MPLLEKKFTDSVSAHFGARQAALIQAKFADKEQLLATPVNEFVASLVKNS
jgi:hypothetical protein